MPSTACKYELGRRDMNSRYSAVYVLLCSTNNAMTTFYVNYTLITYVYTYNLLLSDKKKILKKILFKWIQKMIDRAPSILNLKSKQIPARLQTYSI